MTDETISYIIDLINNDVSHERCIFLRPLSDKVLVGIVWVSKSNGELYKNDGVDMFFIKNEEKQVVSAVLDMGEQDLHVFVKPECRGNGHLAIALKETILPYLFSMGRERQNITFQSNKARRHAALVGFQLTSDSSAVIYPKDLPQIPTISPGTTSPSEIQKERIKQRIRMASDLLKIARDDLQTSFGENDEWEELDTMSRDVANSAWSVHDLWQDYEERLRK